MILVIDHDPNILDKTREILGGDLHVLATSRAKQALRMVGSLDFSIVLVDLELPDGALALIRSLHAMNPGLPIIGIGATTTAGILAEIKSLGVVEVVPKPASPAWKPVIERVRTFHRGG